MFEVRQSMNPSGLEGHEVGGGQSESFNIQITTVKLDNTNFLPYPNQLSCQLWAVGNGTKL